MGSVNRLLLIGLFITVTACSQHPNITGNNEAYYPPPNDWQVKGKLGLRTENESGSVLIDWQQQKESYSIRIKGPFGQGNAWIKGNLQWITIQQTDGQSVTSTAPEQLLEETLGWFIPINDLRYWVRGMSNSDKTVDEPVYNEQGLLVAFEQADWSVSISRYRLTEKWLLPNRVKLNKGNVQLTLAIHKWQFPQLPGQYSTEP